MATENKQELASTGVSRMLWLYLIFAIPALIMFSFWLTGYLGR